MRRRVIPILTLLVSRVRNEPTKRRAGWGLSPRDTLCGGASPRSNGATRSMVGGFGDPRERTVPRGEPPPHPTRRGESTDFRLGTLAEGARTSAGAQARRLLKEARVARALVSGLVAFGVLLPPAAGANGPQVSQFSPQGVVKKVRQVGAQFSDAMVALGDPRVTAPFEVTCPEAGTGRWLDSRSWVFDFDRDLPAGIRCGFRLKPDAATLDGRPLVGQREFAFSTGGPAILRSVPWEGDESIDEEQAFILTLDADPDERSVLEHVSFEVEGLAERVGVRLVTGAVAEQLVRTRGRPDDRAPVLVVQARQRFPNGAAVRLVWGRGVAATGGVAGEQDQVLAFRVRPAFSVSVECERERPTAGCIPIAPLSVRFSAPVLTELARQVTVRDAHGRAYGVSSRHEREDRTTELVFKGPFPEASALTVALPPGFRDDAGRAPANASEFPRQVATESYPALAKFASRFGIIEMKADPALPVTLRNVEPEVATTLLRLRGEATIKGTVRRITADAADMQYWLRRVAATPRHRSVFADVKGRPAPAPSAFELPKPNGAAAFEVIGIPLGAVGFYVVELESLKLGSRLLDGPRPMYVPAAALVTNLAVHYKWSRDAALVWVTTLDQGQPVPDAKVSIHTCDGTTLWSGSTNASGLAWVKSLPDRDPPRCPENQDDRDVWSYQRDALADLQSGLLVVARSGADVSFTHSTWTEGIEPWRFQLPGAFETPDLAAHTILDRSLCRAGETVHMKHVLRLRTAAGLSPVPASRRPTMLAIQHLGSDDRYELPLTWDGGLAESTWPIPGAAKLGRYALSLRRPGAKPGEFEEVTSGELRVEELRVPLMRATLRPPSEALVGVSEFTVDLAVQYLAGGGASGLPVTVRAQLQPRGLPPYEGFEGLSFGAGPVATGIVRDGGDGETGGDEGTPGDGRGRAGPAVHQRESVTLDAAGTARAVIRNLPPITKPVDVLTELEYRDPTGQVQTASTRVPLWPAAYLAGVQVERASGQAGDTLRVKAAVVDVLGKPVPAAAVQMAVFRQVIYSSRKRLVGGFYAYEHIRETTTAGELCGGATNAHGLFECEPPAPAEGYLLVQASVTDPAGRTSASHAGVWLDADDTWFDVRDSDRIDVLPERRRYEPGETARLQVQMPFRQATALVTTEREGVLDARVVTLTRDSPGVDVPIKPAYAPNIFVSVLAVRGRLTEPRPTAMVDLGRPAFKLGIAELRVGWRPYELKVSVTTDRPVYRVRQKAVVRVEARTTAGASPPAGTEVALAAVDEGLLELLPNASWNLLDAMMARRGYGVTTATAQGQVVGKRHFGLKALPQGGGGGRAVTRELFDTLLLWKARVRLDAQGQAAVQVPLNDSLTAFRIVAVATSPGNLFGTGSTTIRSTQDLMILPGIAPLVREGDRLDAEITLRNTTARAMALRVVAKVDGLPEALPDRSVSMPAEGAATVDWDVAVPAGARALRWEIEVQESGRAVDRIKIVQEVREAVPVRTVQATLFQLAQPAQLPVEQPVGAVAGRGGVGIQLRPTLTEGLGGVRAWLTRYPYTCLEQLVSRSVGLRDQRSWNGLAASLPSYLDGDGLLKFFPAMNAGDPVLTAYVLAIVHESGWSVPPEPRERMLGGLTSFVEGKLVRGSRMPAADLTIRKLSALEALSRYTTVDPALLGSLAIEPNLWPTSALLDWWGVLQRTSGLPDRATRLSQAEQILRSRLTLQGTTAGFSTDRTDGLWWLLVSPDSNLLRLIAHLVETNQWRGELPGLVRGALGRQHRGAWDLTTANAWGALAIEKFSRAFETVPVGGETDLALDTSQRRVDWARTPKGDRFLFPWPAGQSMLRLSQSGAGHPWVTIQSEAAIPLREALASGYRITRTLTPIEVKRAGSWSRGDIARVRLTIEAQADMTWVVVADPIPGGAAHLGTGLARDSQIAAGSEPGDDSSAWPAFEERAFDAYRSYYAWLPKGTHTVEYTIRLNQSGQFLLPPTRVEALYAPEAFGEIPNAPIVVEP